MQRIKLLNWADIANELKFGIQDCIIKLYLSVKIIFITQTIRWKKVAKSLKIADSWPGLNFFTFFLQLIKKRKKMKCVLFISMLCHHPKPITQVCKFSEFSLMTFFNRIFDNLYWFNWISSRQKCDRMIK